MDRLRPRSRSIFSGFTNSEIEKLERFVREAREQLLDKEFCHKISINFNRSAGRAGKPAVRWTEIQTWFEARLQNLPDDNDNEVTIPKEPECKEVEVEMDCDRLSPRSRDIFSGFTDSETEKLERSLRETREQSLDKEFCHKIAINFNRSADRAGKPAVRWTEIQNWFETKLQDLQDDRNNEAMIPKEPECKEGEIVRDLSELEFEAKSSKDGAWYDVETFLAHRFNSNGEAEVLVRFVGFGGDEDEWITMKNSVRKRSIPLENTECCNLNVGDYVLCFQERKDQAIYYDARILEIQRRIHDIRGCRCHILIRYDRDNSEECVRLRRLCRRPAP